MLNHMPQKFYFFQYYCTYFQIFQIAFLKSRKIMFFIETFLCMAILKPSIATLAIIGMLNVNNFRFYFILSLTCLLSITMMFSVSMKVIAMCKNQFLLHFLRVTQNDKQTLFARQCISFIIIFFKHFLNIDIQSI